MNRQSRLEKRRNIGGIATIWVIVLAAILFTVSVVLELIKPKATAINDVLTIIIFLIPVLIAASAFYSVNAFLAFMEKLC